MKRIAVVVSLLFTAVIVAAVIGYAEYADIVIGRQVESRAKIGVKPVLFPHWFHRIRFKCKVCHEDIFILRRGANDINMNAIINGEFCGKCHNGQIAWEPVFCDRCHSWDGPVPPYPESPTGPPVSIYNEPPAASPVPTNTEPPAVSPVPTNTEPPAVSPVPPPNTESPAAK